MLKKPFTPFGVAIKAKLFEMGQTQDWLIAQCREKTGMYVDSGVMNKLSTGRRKSPRIEKAIREVLSLEESKEAS